MIDNIIIYSKNTAFLKSIYNVVVWHCIDNSFIEIIQTADNTFDFQHYKLDFNITMHNSQQYFKGVQDLLEERKQNEDCNSLVNFTDLLQIFIK